MPPILECRGLTKRYGAAEALSGVDLAVEAGGVVGLLGPNGSGKSTLIKLAMGMLRPTAGEIFVDGKAPCPATRAVTSYLPDADRFAGWMRVEQAVSYSEDFFADFRRDRAEELLGRLGIDKKTKVKALSKGNREKLALILATSRDAKLFILDEPIAGVDPAARDFILETVIGGKPADATVLLCTHLIADVEPVLTRAVFLNRGRVVLDEDVQAVCARTGKSLDALFREEFKW